MRLSLGSRQSEAASGPSGGFASGADHHSVLSSTCLDWLPTFRCWHMLSDSRPLMLAEVDCVVRNDLQRAGRVPGSDQAAHGRLLVS